MAKKFIIYILVAVVIAIGLTPQAGWAQAQTTPVEERQVELSGTRKQVATIIFAGLAGAILGLSTLSFYGRPQEKLNNIAIGAALGIFAGAAYTTYKAARAPYEVYRGADLHFDTELEKRFEMATLNQPTPTVGWSWEF